jgi:hypothetical protein
MVFKGLDLAVRSAVAVLCAVLLLYGVFCPQDACGVAHVHKHGSPLCCDLCNAGPLSLVVSGDFVFFQSAFLVVAWLRWHETGQMLLEGRTIFSSPRAPPA